MLDLRGRHLLRWRPLNLGTQRVFSVVWKRWLVEDNKLGLHRDNPRDNLRDKLRDSLRDNLKANLRDKLKANLRDRISVKPTQGPLSLSTLPVVVVAVSKIPVLNNLGFLNTSKDLSMVLLQDVNLLVNPGMDVDTEAHLLHL